MLYFDLTQKEVISQLEMHPSRTLQNSVSIERFNEPNFMVYYYLHEGENYQNTRLTLAQFELHKWALEFCERLTPEDLKVIEYRYGKI